MMINVTIYIKTSVGTSVILVIICPTVIVAPRRYPPLPWECPTRPPGNNTISGIIIILHPVLQTAVLSGIQWYLHQGRHRVECLQWRQDDPSILTLRQWRQKSSVLQLLSGQRGYWPVFSLHLPPHLRLLDVWHVPGHLMVRLWCPRVWSPAQVSRLSKQCQT